MAGTTTSSIPWHELEARTSAELRPGTDADAVGGVVPSRVASPGDEQQVAAILSWANDHDVRVTVSGGGTKQSWSNPPQSIDLLLSTSRLTRVIEHAYEDLTVTVQSGLTVSQLQATLAQHRQRLALDVLWPERATIGGIVAANDSGALRLRFGSIRDLLIGTTVVLADGTIARSGGKVVKNVAGYDLPKLFTGSHGTLGVITEATFRVHPLPLGAETMSFKFSDIAAANRFILSINDSSIVPASVQLCCGSDEPAIVDVLFEGLPAGIAAQAATARELASGAEQVPAALDAWHARQQLWRNDPSRFVAKFSVLPSDIAAFANALGSCSLDYRLVAQATGIGYFEALCTQGDVALVQAELNNIKGSLTLLRVPSGNKQPRDIFGRVPDSQLVMLRIKQRFDPKGILNRGRFIGGI